MEEHRPWGYFAVLSEDEEYKLKKIVVYSGQRLSLQRHRHRSEHWFVLKGEAVVTRNNEELALKKGQSIDIPLGAWHRVMNPGKNDLEIVEVQTGDSFDENDIERMEDDYGRR